MVIFRFLAIRLLQENPPALVLMEIRMPEMGWHRTRPALATTFTSVENHVYDGGERAEGGLRWSS